MMKKEYKRCFVAFLDIIGFKNLVIKADQENMAAEMIDKLETMIAKCIKEAMDIDKRGLPFDIDYQLFSDSLCIYVPIDEEEEGEKIKKYKGHSSKYIENNFLRLWMLCRIIAEIQLESLQFGIIYRGAVSLGGHFHNENITFSKALIDAYLAESTEAIYPRVIILDKPEDDILELLPVIYEDFDLRVLPDDDYLFVDYLGKVDEFSRLLGPECDYIKWHKKIIRDGIENNLEKEKYLEKYVWMMNYHHNRLTPIFGNEICINEELRNDLSKKTGMKITDFHF